MVSENLYWSQDIPDQLEVKASRRLVILGTIFHVCICQLFNIYDVLN